MLRTRRDDTQIRQLRQLACRAVGRVSERAHFVLLSMQGYSPPKIGELMGCDTATVRYWLRAYRDRGLAGLYDAPRSGRPPREKHLAAIVQAQPGQLPPNYGYLQACWTVALLVWHLRERFRIMVSAATVRRALKQAGLRWTRPKLVLPRRQDPRADEKRAKLAEALANPEATVLAEDECDVHLLLVLRAMWQRVRQQLRIDTPGQNHKRGLFGALNLRTGEWFYQLTDRKRSAEFIALLSSVLAAYPAGPIYVIVDNAGIHTSKAVKQWVSLRPRLQLVYLPTYTGHRLSPVEKVWHALKGHIPANRSFRVLAELDEAIRRYFAAFTCEGALRLTNSEVTRAAQAATLKSTKNLPRAA